MGPGGTDQYGCPLATGTHRTGKGKEKLLSSLPAPEGLEKTTPLSLLSPLRRAD